MLHVDHSVQYPYWQHYLLNSKYYFTCTMIVDLSKNPVDGFSAGLVDDDDLYKWEIMIIGPADSY